MHKKGIKRDDEDLIVVIPVEEEPTTTEKQPNSYSALAGIETKNYSK